MKRCMPLFFTLFLLTAWSITGAQVGNDIRGEVRDIDTGEALPYANVSVKGTSRGATTNSDGYFVLVNEPVGLCSLYVSYIGYDPITVPVKNAVGMNQMLQIRMKETVVEVEGVSVTANAEMVEVSRKEISQITISPRQLSKLPSIGEVDVFRSIQLLPGISGASDGESGLYVRGGTPDQNLVLFDGMTIYHVDHFFGFFSAFNADAIKDIQIFKGGFPAEYGGRISSVVNLTGKTGNKNKLQFGVGANLLSTHGYIEIPLWKFGTFLIAARRSYTDFIQSPLYNKIYKMMTGEESNTSGSGPGGQQVREREQSGDVQGAEFQPSFYFYDLNSKLTLLPSSKDIVTLSFYSGKDDLDKSQDYSQLSLEHASYDASVQLETIDINRWGNLGSSAKWARQWGSRLHTDLLVAYSEYFSTYNKDRNLTVFQVVTAEDSSGSNLSIVNSSLEDNKVKDFTGRLGITWNIHRAHTLKAGVWVSRFDSKYEYTLDDTTNILDRIENGLLASYFIQDNWKIGISELTVGLRASRYDQTKKWYFEPRASFNVSFTPQLILKGGWGHYSQFVNRIVNENVLEGSRDFWILADENLKPSLSEHWILGLDYDMEGWLFSVEGYYKSMKNLVEFTRRFTGQADYSDYFFIGDGLARGAEILIQKKKGRLSGWLGYTLQKVDNTYPSFNDGESFPADNDRRHEFNAVAKYTIGVWTFAATCVYATGDAYTAPESQYVLEMLNGQKISYIHVGKKNGYRMPDYFRLDLSVSRQFQIGRFDSEFGLSIFNTTNHKNVWYREYNMETVPVTITDALMLGFTPTVYVQFNFK